MADRATCRWLQDDQDQTAWETECGRWFIFDDDEKTPQEARMNYCCYCGGALTQTPLWERDE